MDDTSQFILRFDRLMRDVESGLTERNSFRPWEVELLVDMMNCKLGSDRKRVLRRYQRAVHRSIERGDPRPLKLSAYLSRSRKDPHASAA